MALVDQLRERREAVLERWLDVALGDYPEETARFLRTERDQFANPVGHSTRRGLEGLLGWLLRETGRDEAQALLDGIVRIRALQDLSAGRALAFILELKELIRAELAAEIEAGRISQEELCTLEKRVDGLALLAFDIYVECREQIHRIRLEELRRASWAASRLARERGLSSDQLARQEGV